MHLELPTIQNWSCHNCGGCCKQHQIEISPEERQRILDQQWTVAQGLPPNINPIETFGSWFQPRYRLAHQADGSCVFLDDKGLCRIHARFGEPAKPIACRLYPYAFHPDRNGVAVALRFSCPSVARNAGQPVAEQRNDLEGLARQVVPAQVSQWPPPKIHADLQTGWPEFQILRERLDTDLNRLNYPLSQRLAIINTWTKALVVLPASGCSGETFRAALQILFADAELEFRQIRREWLQPPSATGAVYFRTIVAHFARRDTAENVRSGLLGRWKRFRALVAFTRGQGTTPSLHPDLPPVPFEKLASPFPLLTPDIEGVLTHYFRVKFQSLHFCGRAFYGRSFSQGAAWQIAMFPIICYLARWVAIAAGRNSLETEDVIKAINIADHHFGYSPNLGSNALQKQIDTLSLTGDLIKLCFWYGK